MSNELIGRDEAVRMAQNVVRDWAEHDLDDTYNSDYLRDALHSVSLEERIVDALASLPVGKAE